MRVDEVREFTRSCFNGGTVFVILEEAIAKKDKEGLAAVML
jgi:hypothetical protein